MKKRWFEYKQPKRRQKAWEEENKSYLIPLRQYTHEFTKLAPALFFGGKKTAREIWEEFIEK